LLPATPISFPGDYRPAQKSHGGCLALSQRAGDLTCQSKETMRLHFQGQAMQRLHKETRTASAALVMSSFKNGKRHKSHAPLSMFRM
jgi:hypothetical protein